jgi:hypothetical protein
MPQSPLARVAPPIASLPGRATRSRVAACRVAVACGEEGRAVTNRLYHTAVIVVAVTVVGALAGCSDALTPGTTGSGQEASEQRDVAAFERIEVAGQTAVTVASGDPSVTVRGDDNLIGEVVTDVNDGTLTIDEQRHVDPRAGLVVEVTAPRLRAAAVHGSGDLTARDVAGGPFTATLDGSGDLTIDGVDADVFTGDLSGSGNLDAAGQAERVDLAASGSGEADLRDLVASEATVDVTGSGDALVQVTQILQASSSGSGDVIYTGDPQDVQENTSGSGDIRPQ